MGLYGAIGGAVIGGVGGLIGNQSAQAKADAAMAGTARYRNGVDRLYGSEQDALIALLQQKGAEQSMSRASVARAAMNRQLAALQAQGGRDGVRKAMMTGGEADLAGQVGEAAGGEIVGNRGQSAGELARAQQDAIARNRLRLEALRLYDAAKAGRKSGLGAFVGGAASGAMTGAAAPI